MVYILNEFTMESFTEVLEDIKKRKKKEVFAPQSIDGSDYQKSANADWSKKNLSKHYGSLIRGLDGVEYQKAARSEWD